MDTLQTDIVKTDENVTLTENGMVTNPTTFLYLMKLTKKIH